MSSSTWEVIIHGQEFDLHHLTRHFNTAPLIVFFDEQDKCYHLTSTDFDNCADSTSVLEAAQGQLSILAGAHHFLSASNEPLHVGRVVYRRHSNGRRDAIIHTSPITARAAIGHANTTYTDSAGVVHPAPPHRMVVLAKLARSDKVVAKALRLRGADGNSWVGLYRLHEVVSADVGGDGKLAELGGVSKQTPIRFRHCANSVKVAGDDSRHGYETNAAPKHPMTLDEAAAYVNLVLNAWFAMKGA